MSTKSLPPLWPKVDDLNRAFFSTSAKIPQELWLVCPTVLYQQVLDALLREELNWTESGGLAVHRSESFGGSRATITSLEQ